MLLSQAENGTAIDDVFIFIIITSVMSLASKLTLATAFAGTASIIYYVHYRQVADKDQLHQVRIRHVRESRADFQLVFVFQGIIRDVERQHMRQTQNLHALQQQGDMTQRYRRAAEKEERGRKPQEEQG